MVYNIFSLLIFFTTFSCFTLCARLQLLLECIPPDQYDNNANDICPDTSELVCSVSRSRDAILYQIGSQYQNSCLACQDESVSHYFEGSCDQNESNTRFCNLQELSMENCYQMENDYVCAIFNATRCFKSRKVTYLNACYACKSSQVNRLLLGPCRD